MGKILITGGAGFIGSNLAVRLAGRREIVVCDRLRQADCGKWANLAGAPLGDLITPERLSDFLAARGEALSAVVHLGAVSSTTETDVDHILAQNYTLSQTLWRWCAQAQKPLFYASSAAVYGDGGQGFVDDNRLEAVARLRPLNPYGWSKQLFDLWALREAQASRAPPRWAGLRFFNVYGPREQHKGPQCSVAVQMFERIAAAEPVRLFRSHRSDVPDGGQRRDFVFVEDACAVIEWLLEGGVQAGLVNVGSGDARSFRDLAEAACSSLDRALRINWIDTPPTIRDKYQYFTQANLDRLRGLGFTAPMSRLEDGVGAYAQWWRANAPSA